ncbi:MAG: SpoIIIAH-like family protein [Bacillota bacterium]|nr:SpoIIIAH-like family protein [Bacillota bacterium]
MRINKRMQDSCGKLLCAKTGFALLLLFFLFAAAWSWLSPAAPEEESFASWEDIPEPEEAEPEEPELDEAQVAAAYFAAYRMDREEARSAELLVLEQIIADADSSAEAVSQAEQRRLAIAACADRENQAESLLSAKGFGETVVILGEERATVIVNVEMNALKATQIAEAVDGVSGCGFENVVVVNR